MTFENKMKKKETWVATQVVTPVRRDAIARARGEEGVDKNNMNNAMMMILKKKMKTKDTWVATHVVTPVRREAIARHSSTTPGLFALMMN